MKNRIYKIVAIMSLVAFILSGCGNAREASASNEVISANQETGENTTEPTNELVVTETPSSTQTPEVTPEATEKPTPTPEPTEEPVREIPEDREWIDDLYAKLIALDVDGVVEILNDPELVEKAAPFEYPEFSWWDYETGYKLLTTDGKIVGLTVYDSGAIYAFFADREDTDYGFDTVNNGDIFIYIQGGKSGYFDGRYDHRADGSVYDNGEDPGMPLMIWHY